MNLGGTATMEKVLSKLENRKVKQLCNCSCYKDVPSDSFDILIV